MFRVMAMSGEFIIFVSEHKSHTMKLGRVTVQFHSFWTVDRIMETSPQC